MVKLVLDPAVGNQTFIYDFKKEFSLPACLPKIYEGLNVPKDDFSKFVLMFKESGRFVSKVEELCIFIYSKL